MKASQGGEISAVTPVLAGDIYLEMPLPQLNPDGQHREARLLTWLHGQPIGEVHHGVLVRWR